MQTDGFIGPDSQKAEPDCLSRNASLSLFRDLPEDDVLPPEGDPVREPGYTSQNLDVPVVIVSSEINPYSKSGGLALVTASLSHELSARGHRTMAISPMYDNYKGAQVLGSRKIWVFGEEHEVQYFHIWHPVTEGKGVDFIFVDHPSYHRPGGLYYNAAEGVEYHDNLFRFALLSLAALDAPVVLQPGGVAYGERVSFIANDWQTALLPVYLTHRMRKQQRFKDARCVFIVHNFGYQGIYPHNKLVPNPNGTIPHILKNVDIADFGLDGTAAYEHMVYQYPAHERNYHGDDGNVWNLTKGALMTADRLLTVSPGYASEMMTPDGGFRLEELVKQKAFVLNGILNGIDVVTYNPKTDQLIEMNYTVDTVEEGKRHCKVQLQERVGLDKNVEMVVVGFVGRLTAQKGIDLILEAMEWMMTDTGNKINGHVQFLFLGNGDERYVQAIREQTKRWPGRVSGMPFDPQLEHVLYAGSDFLMMPSRYEPCGLPQMCAQRYGTVPIVTLCGGLKDSVIVEPEDQATGFGILPLDIHKYKEVSYEALETYYLRREQFNAMQRRGLQMDFSWVPRIDEYEKNLDWALGDPPYVR